MRGKLIPFQALTNIRTNYLSNAVQSLSHRERLPWQSITMMGEKDNSAFKTLRVQAFDRARGRNQTVRRQIKSWTQRKNRHIWRYTNVLKPTSCITFSNTISIIEILSRSTSGKYFTPHKKALSLWLPWLLRLSCTAKRGPKDGPSARVRRLDYHDWPWRPQALIAVL